MASTAPVSSSTPERHIVIVGGGIIGCTTAYYLATHPAHGAQRTTITVLEASQHGAAQGASGKAGGLVAQWAYPRELVGVSFAEHARLAETHGGAARWGWRVVGCGSWQGRGEALDDAAADGEGAAPRRSLEKTLGLEGQPRKTRAQRGLPDDLDWVKDELTDAYSPMAKPGATAQVHPYLFTTSMLQLAQERGVKYVQGKATSIDIDRNTRAVTGVTYTTANGEQHTLQATHVVVAAGVWSPRLIPQLPIEGTRAHSIVLRPTPGTRIAPYVLFTEIALPPTRARPQPEEASPEIYARPDDEVYCCGPGDDAPVPDTVDTVPVDARACEAIRAHVASISPQLRAARVETRQACFLPVVRTGGGGGPIVGEAKSLARGLYIATGHTCWVSASPSLSLDVLGSLAMQGICNAPGTAKAIAELIMDGRITCANLNKLHPDRFL